MSNILSKLISPVLVAAFTFNSAHADEPLVLDQPPASAPLENLKQRSGSKRWEQIRGNLKSPPRTAAGELKQQNVDLPQPAPQSLLRTRRPEPILRRIPLAPPTVSFSETEQANEVDDDSLTSKEESAENILPEQQPVRIAAQPLGTETFEQPVQNPAELKKITAILPYFDYEPNADVHDDDSCRNLCPRPDGKPCKIYPEGANMPQCPEQFPLSDEIYAGRYYSEMMYLWNASDLYHNPLYFSDIPLERYGHTYSSVIQPFASIARFGVQVLGMPYQMTIDPPDKKEYKLGLYRPGECAPYLFYQVPWNTEAAAVQAGVVTGLFYAIP